MQAVSRLAFLELTWHQAATTTVFSVQESQQLSIGKRMAQMQKVQGSEWVPQLVNAKPGKLLVPSHSYLSRKVQHQCTENVFRDKLPASYRLQNWIAQNRERHFYKTSRRAGHWQTILNPQKGSSLWTKGCHCSNYTAQGRVNRSRQKQCLQWISLVRGASSN